MLNEKLFISGTRVAVALSGGKDSMCLISLLLSRAKDLKITVKAINVDHGIRGENSVKDSDFVKSYCEKNNVELFFRKYDCIAYAEQNSMSLEESARHLRYKCFREAVESGFCDVVATAHHLSDNAETVLFNLFRGSSLAGLKGIAEKRDYIIRPMLSAEREDIDGYIKENGIPFVTDETNAITDYSRNFIRLILSPLIKEKFPGFERSVYRFSSLAASENAYLDALAEKAVSETGGEYSVSDDADPCIYSRSVIKVMKKLGIKRDYEKIHVDALLALRGMENGSETTLKCGVVAVKDYGKVTFYKPRNVDSPHPVPFALGRTVFGDTEIEIAESVSGEGKVLFFDGDKIPEGAVIRFRMPGDVFRKFGGGEKKLKDYFIDEKIPARERDFLPVLAVGNKVLLIFGYEISDEIKVDKSTACVLKCILNKTFTR